MKLHRVAAHAILAVGGLVLAYLVWTDDAPAAREGEVTIFECAPDAVHRIELTGEREDVRVELSRDREDHADDADAADDAPPAWITVTERPEEGEPTTARFVGSQEAIEAYLEKVAPLRARRSLGVLGDEELASVGLDAPEGQLVLACGGREARFSVGGRAYGRGDRYLREEDGGTVYLVASDRLAPLESAEHRLMQRQLHTFAWREVVSLTVRAFGADKTLRQRNRHDPRRAEWVDAAAPDRRNELYGNWLSRYPRLRVQDYLGPDARPGADLEDASRPAQRVLRLEMEGEDGRLGFAELQRVDATPPAYYARTETTRSWVRVPTSVARALEEDLRPVLGLAEGE